ncbi:MAG: HAMP domain-containing protein [Acidobacteriales bacterium]|nr:HAMP domain-containing protein [Terriglobales bacterium]
MPESGNPPKSRWPMLLVLGSLALLLAFLQFSQASLNLSFIQPESPAQTLVFIALSGVIFLVFVALSFMLVRNLLKLLAERRLRVLGSRFRTRMAMGGLVLSFLPTIFLFLFAYVLMNRTIDKWFSRPVEELRDDTAQVAQLLSAYAADRARAESLALASNPDVREAVQNGELAAASSELSRHAASLQGGFVIIVKGGKIAGQFKPPAGWEAQRGPLLALAAAPGAVSQQIMRIGSVDYLGGASAVDKEATVIVALPLPTDFKATLDRIDSSQKRYYELSQQRKQVRRFYMQLLLLLTVLMLFASTWLSLFVARLVTRPVAALAEATKEISEGNLQYRVQVTAADELGELITSFNRMASELENNRRHIEIAGKELAETNVALSEANAAIEQRRAEIETILENIPTGVLSLDPQRKVLTSNRAFEDLFSVEEVASGTPLAAILDPALSRELEQLMRRADRMGSASRQLELKGRQVDVTVAPLQHRRQRLGYVLVFEDLSDLLKAQKQIAWQDVARRVAHEIKNPLTPIALSAERIRKHLERGAPEPESLSVIQSCTETISSAVETVRALVDEFAALARFPTAQPQPANINAIVESALSLFNGRLDGIQVQTDLASGLPPVMADPEGIKRVVANLVDNAAEAMRDSLVREIHISTALLQEGEEDTVEIAIADSGHGVSNELREKLFLPYFSTKDRGTGLGLAIVSRIVEEHHGTVRVEENKPMGSRFVVELPVAGNGAQNQ